MIRSKTTLGLLALWLVPGLGPRRLELLLNELGSLEAVFRASPATLSGITGLNAERVQPIPDAMNSEALKTELSLIEKQYLNFFQHC